MTLKIGGSFPPERYRPSTSSIPIMGHFYTRNRQMLRSNLHISALRIVAISMFVGLFSPNSVSAALIGFYTFDDNAANSTVVNSAVGANATLVTQGGGGTLTSGVYAAGAGWDGGGAFNISGNKVELPATMNASLFNGATGATVAFWIKNITRPDNNWIFGANQAFVINDQAQLDAEALNPYSYGGKGIGFNLLNNPNWQFVALTVDNVNSVATIYVDGAIINQYSGAGLFPVVNPVNGTQPLALPQSYGAHVPNAGLYDDLRVYNEVLSQSQIQALMVQEQSAVPEPSTYALGLIGLAGLGFVVWRRRK
jgi:hypothetical protein